MNWKNVLATAVCAGALYQPASAQRSTGSLLQIEVRDQTLYVLNDVEPSQLGKNLKAGPLPSSPNALYESVIGIGDIVAVNGTPAKGTAFLRETTFLATPNFTPGQGIADISRGGFYEWTLELMNPDGTLIGSIGVSGMAGGGPRPPGAPSVITRTSYMVVAGTGPFLGAHGYMQNTTDPARPERHTSAAEDPAYRRINGGGSTRVDLYLIPTSRPEIVTTSSGPAVFHSDFSPVTTISPAKAGEILIVKSTGLGPTVPGVDPGQAFPTDGLQQVNSPIGVTVNGVAADVINAIGWPGLVDTYRVDFRVPNAITSGTAAIQLTAAWIAGAATSIPVQ
jgi:hypothetical protein